MKAILLDTNVLIQREDYRVIRKDLQLLSKLLMQLGYTQLIHPKSIEELRNDRDERRKEIVLSKIASYPLLESPPDPSTDATYLSIILSEKDNAHDEIDNMLLYSVYRHAVNFLITEDKRIHKNALRLGISDYVLTISEAESTFSELLSTPQEVSTPPAISVKPLHNLKLEDQFFDSLRTDYGDASFNKWFTEKASDKREAFVHFNEDGSLGAFLMLKDEDEEIKSQPHRIPKAKRLKICTLKVSCYGSKLGELLLSIAFNYAVKNGYGEIYLTHYVKEDDSLINLIEKFGFVKNDNHIIRQHRKDHESIYIKLIQPPGECSIEDLRQVYFPCLYDGEKVRKFVVPIRPEFHSRLFTDSKNRQTALSEFHGGFITEGNTILKAYLCNSSIRQIHTNDILLFYRSGPRNGITSIGTVDVVYYDQYDVDTIVNYVLRRTVYTKNEILSMKKPLMILLFKLHFHFPDRAPLTTLVDKHILKSAPQSILQLGQESYLKLKRLSGLDEQFTRW